MRVGAGLSLRYLAAQSGSSHQQLMRFERGELDRVSIRDLGAWCALLGLDLVIRTYPAGDPVRDKPQLSLLERLRSRLHPSLGWRTEVPLPIGGDMRAWDAVISGRQPVPWRTRIEAETVITDAQALERRLALKYRDDPDGRLILLVADTRANRQMLPLIRPGLRELLPCDTRSTLRALGRGEEPPANGLVML